MQWKIQISLLILGLLTTISLIWILRAILPTIAAEDVYFPISFNGNLKSLNGFRVKESQELFRLYRNNQQRIFSFSITIITAHRPQNYLIQSIGYLFGEYANRARPYVEICNTDHQYSPFLDEIRDYINIFNVSETIRYDMNSLSQRLEKEARDYWKCLRKSDRHSQFVLVLEDDAVVTPGFSQFIQSVISHLKSHDWIDYVKLYHPPTKRCFPGLFLILIISILLTAILLRFSGFISQKSHPKASIVVFIAIFTCFILIKTIWLIGGSQFPADLRHFFSRGIYLSYPESCCTQAVLFRTSRIDEIVDELIPISANRQQSKDDILDFSRFIGRSTDSNLFVHIGSYSSILRETVLLDDMVRGFQLSDD